jgi:hypothetical protein
MAVVAVAAVTDYSFHLVTSSNKAFFSENRIKLLCHKLGHDKLRALLETISTAVAERMNATGGLSPSMIKFQKPAAPAQISPADARLFIDCMVHPVDQHCCTISNPTLAYFDKIHPIFPFLHQDKFEKLAYAPELSHILTTDAQFTALYHAVLALGSQYHDGGTFDPGKGATWRLFQVSLGLLPELLLPQENLTTVQVRRWIYTGKFR